MSQELETIVTEETASPEVVETSSRDIVREICQPYILDDDVLRQFKNLFQIQHKRGLCKFTKHRATVKCLITHFQSLPTGCETGRYLAIHLGGANLHIFMVKIRRKKTVRIDSEYKLENELVEGPGLDLFNFIADCLAEFLKTNVTSSDKKLPLAFIFPFPYRQNSRDSGILISWSRGFSCSGVIGEDVVELLRRAIDRKGIVNVEVTALLNDSIGVLMSCAWYHRYCKIGVVIEDEFRAGYLEKTKNVHSFDSELNNREPTIVIDCEFSSFGDKGTLEFIRTQHDKAIDKNSDNRQNKLFEKMITGKNMGELVRRIMLECCTAGALFDGHESEELAQEKTFKLSHLFKVAEDTSGSYDNTKEILNEMGYANPTEDDCENVRFICECVAQRSAHLVAAILSSLVERVGDPYLFIGIQGRIYEKHPHYHSLLNHKMKSLTRPENKFDIALSDEGSENSASVSGAVVSILKKKSFGSFHY